MAYKLVAAQHLNRYRFSLQFADGKSCQCDLEPLLANHLQIDDLGTMHIDPEWGCLEFLQGRVDIAPATLYRFASPA